MKMSYNYVYVYIKIFRLCMLNLNFIGIRIIYNKYSYWKRTRQYYWRKLFEVSTVEGKNILVVRPVEKFAQVISPSVGTR